MILKTILICCLLWIYVSSQCVPSPGLTPSPSDPPFPVLPDTFQTRLEANIQDKGYSVTVEEYFDNDLNKATLRITRDASTVSLIYDYANNQVFYVQGIHCQIHNLSSDPNTMLFGDVKVNGLPHVYSTNQALHFAKSSGQTYKGQQFIRGIKADWWSTCLTWPQLNSTFTLDYFFTAVSWDDPVDFPQIPVRAVAKGVQIQANGTGYSFSHTYDYFDFRIEIEQEDTIFETPRGVICPGRVSTRPLPSIPDKYHYRQEIITPELGTVVTADVWYDKEYQLVRYDYHSLGPTPPTYSMNPLSEVHDFKTGIRYIRDLVTGNCTALPISNTSFDVVESTETIATNSSYVIHMKNPLQFFGLDDSYTYTGQRTARGATCDVFSTYKENYMFQGTKTSAIFEYYFLSGLLSEYPDDGSTNPSDIPYMLLLSVFMHDNNLPEVTITYNFLDFDVGHPSLSVFDISPCYAKNANLQFRVKFPGMFAPDTKDLMMLKTRMIFAETMNVSYIRIQDVRMDYDNSNVYVSAKLLDRSPNTAQFTLISNKIIEKHDDLVYSYVASPNDCAKYCIENIDFVCNSFDFCPSDQNGNCRLSKSHIADGSAVLVNSTCNHFSRTVNGPVVQETSVAEAYAYLRQAVFGNKISISIFEDNDATIQYLAVDVEVTYGLLQYSAFPSVDGQFSYYLEVGVPLLKMAHYAHIWYDYTYKLVRYDVANEDASTGPFYTANPMTYIHDFNTGLAYNIDKALGNCSITSIANNSFDSSMNTNAFLKNGAYVVKLKDPINFFSLNDSFKFVGQKTIRGQLCNVFEATTTDFHLNGISQPFTSNLQFYALSDGWAVTPSGSSSPATSQPIRMDLSAPTVGLFLMYNFYDFNLQTPDLKNFDITPCFDGPNKRNFMIGFKGPYHPYLDSNSNLFKQEAQILLAQATKASPIRFQNTYLTYSKTRVYLIGTVVDVAPYIDDFTKTSGKSNPNKNDASFTKVTSAATCASLCRAETNFACESFDFCSSSSTCSLSHEHVDDGPSLSASTTCDHYSRTVNSTDPVQPTIDALMIKLNDVIYKGLFAITISIANGQQQVYTANFITDNLLNAGSQGPTSNYVSHFPNNCTIIYGQILKHFTVTKKNVFRSRDHNRLNGVSVDQCASACLDELSFDCQGFNYCFHTGRCVLTSVHPDTQLNGTVPTDFCDLYTRNYLDNYVQSPGMVINVHADQEVDAVTTANICAKRCSQYDQFTCRSFEYCPPSQQCLLLKKHKLDIPDKAMMTSATCSFYTRSYLKDFKKSSHATISVGQTLELDNVSASACAKFCMDDLTVNCQSFVFCGNSSTCRLMSAHPKQKGVTVTKDSCDLYSRQYISAGTTQTSNTNKQKSNAPTSSHGYSAGALGGLAIAMFLIGIVMGAGIIYIVRRKREQEGADTFDMKQIVNPEESDT